MTRLGSFNSLPLIPEDREKPSMRMDWCTPSYFSRELLPCQWVWQRKFDGMCGLIGLLAVLVALSVFNGLGTSVPLQMYPAAIDIRKLILTCVLLASYVCPSTLSLLSLRRSGTQSILTNKRSTTPKEVRYDLLELVVSSWRPLANQLCLISVKRLVCGYLNVPSFALQRTWYTVHAMISRCCLHWSDDYHVVSLSSNCVVPVFLTLDLDLRRLYGITVLQARTLDSTRIKCRWRLWPHRAICTTSTILKINLVQKYWCV